MENSTGSTIGTVSGRRKNKGRSGEDGHRIGPQGRGGAGGTAVVCSPPAA